MKFHTSFHCLPTWLLTMIKIKDFSSSKDFEVQALIICLYISLKTLGTYNILPVKKAHIGVHIELFSGLD